MKIKNAQRSRLLGAKNDVWNVVIGETGTPMRSERRASSDELLRRGPPKRSISRLSVARCCNSLIKVPTWSCLKGSNILFSVLRSQKHFWVLIHKLQHIITLRKQFSQINKNILLVFIRQNSFVVPTKNFSISIKFWLLKQNVLLHKFFSQCKYEHGKLEKNEVTTTK